jgi:hypothetical protein
MNTTTLIKKARRVRDTARALGNLQKSNRINSLVYLVNQAGDRNPETLKQLEDLCEGVTS